MALSLLVERFKAQVDRVPNRAAVSDAERSLTYAELDEQSQRVAHALSVRGLPRDARVAMLCGHGVDAIVGMVGAIKAGLCLVPLNVQESDPLLRKLWVGASPAALIADPENALRAEMLCESPKQVVAISALPKQEGEGLGDEPTLGDRSSDLLAIVYTSGSTAMPKGAMTQARSVLARVDQYLEKSGLDQDGRQASITPWHFAAAFPEVYGALLSGAELCLYDAHSRGALELGAWVKARGIDYLQLPVALLRRILSEEAGDLSALSGVRFATIAGDRLRRDEAKALLERIAPGGRLLHTYGSTETNLIAQLELRLPVDMWPADTAAGFLPVGPPVAGKVLHFLDAEGAALAPPHVQAVISSTEAKAGTPLGLSPVGEIAVEADLLSPGYFGQPDQTAKSFRTLSSGRRLYLTGDLGRLREDGCLEVVGRLSSHVKVRGMRIVVGAVEAAILALPRVANVAVVPRETEEGDVQLIAHVEAVAGQELDVSWLREALHERLPAHGVPARFVFTDSLPLTSSGKVDRPNLPDPGKARPRLAQPFIAPRSKDEARVVELWCRMLFLDTVGVDDDFYDLGGDSLALLKMLSDLEASEGVPLPLHHLQGAPTPARIASLLGLSRESKLPHSADPLSGAGPNPVGVDFGGGTRRQSKKWKHRFKEQARNIGPVFRGRALPYGWGLPLQDRIAARIERDPRFRRFLDPVRIWHERLSLERSLEDAVRRSVLSNTWQTWRSLALAPESVFRRWVVLEGVSHLEAAMRLNRGIVLVTTHTGFNGPLQKIPQLSGHEWFQIRQATDERFGMGASAGSTERARQLQESAGVLSRGGIALIAGDGKQGAAIAEVPFFGAQRSLRPGAAALAETTGATLLPVFGRIETSGHLIFEFGAPITSRAGSREGRIRDCSRQYGERLVESWPRTFDSLRWHTLRASVEFPEGG